MTQTIIQTSNLYLPTILIPLLPLLGFFINALFGKKLGQSLISDENGTLKIIFYLSSGISSNSYESIPVKVSNLEAGRKEVVVTTINQTTLPDSYYNSSTSFGAAVLGLDKIV